jgi:hypothetical protein
MKARRHQFNSSTSICLRKIVAEELERVTGLNPHYRDSPVALTRPNHAFLAFI